MKTVLEKEVRPGAKFEEGGNENPPIIWRAWKGD